MTAPNDNGAGFERAIDMAVIESLRELGGEDDPGLVRELVDMFLADAPKRIKEIEAGLARGDVKLVERAAHTLKSSAANLGAMALSGICRQMEESARAAELAQIPGLYEQSKRSLHAAALALRSLG